MNAVWVDVITTSRCRLLIDIGSAGNLLYAEKQHVDERMELEKC